MAYDIVPCHTAAACLLYMYSHKLFQSSCAELKGPEKIMNGVQCCAVPPGFMEGWVMLLKCCLHLLWDGRTVARLPDTFLENITHRLVLYDHQTGNPHRRSKIAWQFDQWIEKSVLLGQVRRADCYRQLPIHGNTVRKYPWISVSKKECAPR